MCYFAQYQVSSGTTVICAIGRIWPCYHGNISLALPLNHARKNERKCKPLENKLRDLVMVCLLVSNKSSTNKKVRTISVRPGLMCISGSGLKHQQCRDPRHKSSDS